MDLVWMERLDIKSNWGAGGGGEGGLSMGGPLWGTDSQLRRRPVLTQVWALAVWHFRQST